MDNTELTIRANSLELTGAYTNTDPVTHQLNNVISMIDNAHLDADSRMSSTVNLSVRIVTKRSAGRIAFVTVNDTNARNNTDSIQLFLSPEFLDKTEIKFFMKNYHIGDVINVSGFPGLSKTGERSIYINWYAMVAKCLNAFPKMTPDENGVVRAELNDETIHEDPVLSLMVTSEYRQTLTMRSKIVRSLRNYMEDNTFMEVETPVLSSSKGGANAERFVAHSESQDIPMYLRVAPELYLKRLVISGMGNVFEIGKNYRNEGMDRTHSPEFTALEAYSLNTDYHYQADLVTNMFAEFSNQLNIDNPLENVITINLRDEVNTILISNGYFATGYTQDEADSLRNFLNDNSILVDNNTSVSDMMEDVLDNWILPSMNGAVFVMDYPVDSTPLAKRNKDGSCQKWDLYVNGMELATAYTENNDPVSQESLNDPDFIHAVNYGMPNMSGLGIGVDRLIMILTGARSINDVVAFPHRSV